jgi:chlorobactene glucosyltransferase
MLACALAVLLFSLCFWGFRLRDALLTLKALPLPDRSTPPRLPTPPPRISALVPANNEERNIKRCVESLLAQDYPNLEVIVVDDRSTDSTAAIARDLNLGGRSVVVVTVKAIPPGWTGKCHALTRGVERASGEWFVFLDADSRLAPDAISRCMSLALSRGVSLLTLTPKPEIKTFWEKALQPVFLGVFAMLYPFWKVNNPSSSVAAANGMFILIEGSAYRAVGGHASVRSLAVEDVGLAKRVKHSGFGITAVNGVELMTTRMYSNFRDILDGWTRILVASVDYGLAKTLFLLMTHVLISFPVTASAAAYWYFESAPRFGTAWRAAPFAATAIASTLTVLLFLRQIGVPARYATLVPLGNLFLIPTFIAAIRRICQKSPLVWRGTVYRDLCGAPGRLDPRKEGDSS